MNCFGQSAWCSLVSRHISRRSWAPSTRISDCCNPRLSWTSRSANHSNLLGLGFSFLVLVMVWNQRDSPSLGCLAYPADCLMAFYKVLQSQILWSRKTPFFFRIVVSLFAGMTRCQTCRELCTETRLHCHQLGWQHIDCQSATKRLAVATLPSWQLRSENKFQ